MLVIPIRTEKAYTEQTKRIYMFRVKDAEGKLAIKKAIEDQYKVSVISIRVLTRKGKKTRFSKGKHAYPGTTFRQDKTIAYVTLKEGDSIRIFDEQSENTEDSKKAEKEDKKDKASKVSKKGEK